MRWVWKIGAVLACLVIVGCGSDNGGSSPTATPDDDVVASPTAAPAEMRIENIVWSESVDEQTGEPGAIVEAFTPQSPAVIASIEVENVPAGTEFTATWTLNDQPIEVESMHVQASGDLDHAWVSFSFTRDEGKTYPTGQLGVVITSSSGDMREGSVRIQFP